MRRPASSLSPAPFTRLFALASALSLAACGPSSPIDAGSDASADSGPRSDVITPIDAGSAEAGSSPAALGDLRAFAGATPRCTNETQRCLQACAPYTSECENACLANDLAASFLLAGRPIACGPCLVRQRRVCAAENGCESEVRAFVACVSDCGTDMNCINMNCSSIRTPLESCLQTAAGGMCLTTITHPAVVACFGAMPVADAGVDASAPEASAPDASSGPEAGPGETGAPDATESQTALIDLAGTMVDGTPPTYLVPVRLTQPVRLRSLSISFGTESNACQNARIGDLGLDGLQSIGVTTSAGVRSISVSYSGVDYAPPRVVAYARMAAMPTASNVSTATDASLNGTTIPVRIVGP